MSINNTAIDGELEKPPYIDTWGSRPKTLCLLLRHFPRGKEDRASSFLTLGVIDQECVPGQKLFRENFKTGDFITISGKSRGVTQLDPYGNQKLQPINTIEIKEWN
jgi:hypothetical protein